MAVVGRENGRTNETIITAMLRRLGHDTSDATNRLLALDTLNQTVDEYNLERDWNDRKLVDTVTLVTTQADYNLPTYFRKTTGRAWLLDTSDDRTRTVRVASWDDFTRAVSDEGVGDSDIRLMTVQNRLLDDGTGDDDGSGDGLHVFPAPSSIAVYPKLQYYYYADIAAYADDSTAQGISSALERAIELSALSVLNDYIGDSDKSLKLLSMSERTKTLAVAYDNRLRASNSQAQRGLN